ncbi:MAG: hypothetical protein ACRDWT_12170 [Jatrophihabitantaceae bacterium]
MSRAVAIAWLVRLLTAAGLGVDAGIHVYLAPTQPPGGDISQIDLFYFEGAVSSLAALLVLATAARLVYAFAFLVAASALGAVVLYRYADVGTLGPLPNMYEPFWYSSKTATAIAEAIAAAAAAAGTLLPRHSHPIWAAHLSPDRASIAPH